MGESETIFTGKIYSSKAAYSARVLNREEMSLMRIATKGMATVLLKQFSVEECLGFDRCCCHLLIHGIDMSMPDSAILLLC